MTGAEASFLTSFFTSCLTDVDDEEEADPAVVVEEDGAGADASVPRCRLMGRVLGFSSSSLNSMGPY